MAFRKALKKEPALKRQHDFHCRRLACAACQFPMREAGYAKVFYRVN